jgi:hypothetical protein
MTPATASPMPLALAYGPPQGYPPPPSPYGPPPGFGPPGGGFPPPGGPMMPGSGGDVNTTLPLVLSIVGVVMGFNPIAVVALVFAILATSAKSSGNIEEARKHAKVALVLSIVALGLMVLALVAYVVIFLVIGAAILTGTH